MEEVPDLVANYVGQGTSKNRIIPPIDPEDPDILVAIEQRGLMVVNEEFEHYQDRITQDAAIMAGKPVVKGTRIPVARVIQHLADNPDLDDLFQAFPHLTRDDVKACLAYAYAYLERGRRRAIRKDPTGSSAA